MSEEGAAEGFWSCWVWGRVEGSQLSVFPHFFPAGEHGQTFTGVSGVQQWLELNLVRALCWGTPWELQFSPMEMSWEGASSSPALQETLPCPRCAGSAELPTAFSRPTSPGATCRGWADPTWGLPKPLCHSSAGQEGGNAMKGPWVG